MAEHEPFTWFSYIPGLGGVPHQVLFGLLVLVILTAMSYVAFRRVAVNGSAEALIPSDRLTVRNLLELLTELFLKFLDDNLGHHARKFLPLIGTLGMFILFSNLLGLVPGFLPPTDNLNTTVACALIVFFTTHYVGVKTHGLRYLKHFIGPVWWLAWLMLPIEIISHLARPLSLSVRLFGNIFADHMLMSIALVAPSVLVLFIPPLAMFLGVFVSVVQTLIFVLLSIVYISFALESEEH
jgi:F-type H+-transporting ATPase subunit a